MVSPHSNETTCYVTVSGIQKHIMAVLDGGTFYIRPLKWSDSGWYVYVEDNDTGDVRGHDGPPGPRGQFIFKQVGNKDFYLISTQQRPDWYIYMQVYSDGNIRAYKGDPGPQGHWYVTTTKDGYKQLSTVEWPNWYMTTCI